MREAESGQIAERMVIDALPRAVVVTDPTGTITLWNRAAELLFGWAEAEVVGRSVFDVWAAVGDLAENRRDFEQVATGSRVRGDRVVIRNDGTAVRVLTDTSAVLDAVGRTMAIVGASEDVTERRLEEQRARDLAEHFRLAVAAGGLGTWRWDITTGETIWDTKLELLFGLQPGGFDGTYDTYVSLLHPDDRDAVLAAVRDAVAQKTSYRVEHKVQWPDGTVHWLSGAGAVLVNDDDTVVGTIGCTMDVTDRVQREAEHRLLAAAATEAAERERVQNERLEFLLVINEALNAAVDVRDIMRNVTMAAVPRLGDWCAIHVLADPSSEVPDAEIAHVDPAMVAYARQLLQRFPYDPKAESGVPHVIRTRQVEFIRDITAEVMEEADITDEERHIVGELALRSSIAVPLVKRDRVLGAIQFVMAGSSRQYTDDDVSLAQIVAGRIAASIENRRLMEHQRRIALTLQRSLLPASLPPIPGVDIAVRYWAAGDGTEVGGDFYDVFPLNEPGRWALVIGDVCGTGPDAAALTGLARHTIRTAAWHGDDPQEVLRSLNAAILRSGVDSFCTAIFASLERTRTGIELTLASGGHPPPIKVDSRGATPVLAPGTLLGMLDEVHIGRTTTALRPGETLVLYTDGATDLPPPHGLSTEQLAELVAVCAQGPNADHIANQIHDALQQASPFGERSDDLALLVLHISNA